MKFLANTIFTGQNKEIWRVCAWFCHILTCRHPWVFFKSQREMVLCRKSFSSKQLGGVGSVIFLFSRVTGLRSHSPSSRAMPWDASRTNIKIHRFLYCLWLLPCCYGEWSSCTEIHDPQNELITIALLQNKCIDSYRKNVPGEGGGILIESVMWNM